MQRRYADPDDETGDCLAACVASIMELTLDEVPDFCSLPVKARKSWVQQMDEWFEARGWGIVYTDKVDPYPSIHNCTTIINLRNPEPFQHMVHSVVGEVGKKTYKRLKGSDAVMIQESFKIIHDPHPNSLLTAQHTIVGFYFLIPPMPNQPQQESTYPIK